MADVPGLVKDFIGNGCPRDNVELIPLGKYSFSLVKPCAARLPTSF